MRRVAGCGAGWISDVLFALRYAGGEAGSAWRQVKQRMVLGERSEPWIGSRAGADKAKIIKVGPEALCNGGKDRIKRFSSSAACGGKGKETSVQDGNSGKAGGRPDVSVDSRWG